MTEAPPKSWKEKRTVRLLVLSPSQMEEAELCIRKWWLHKVRGLKTSKKHSQTFGTVLHAVTERFLKADNTGRDASGHAVELYPPDWTKAQERWAKATAEGEEPPPLAEITPAEADTIQRLVKEAIEGGVLERLGQPQDRETEVEFREEIVSLKCPKCHGTGWVLCPDCKLLGSPCGSHTQALEDWNEIACDLCHGDCKGDHIQVTGFIDYCLPAEIQDHKSTSAMKWAKSKDALKKNIQMLIYAHALLMQYTKQGKPLPTKITLRHNVYCKDINDLRVRKTETYVTPEEVEQFWEGIVAMAIRMSNLRRTANGWHDCPPPASNMQACQAYGGCDYRGICGGIESEEMYEKRLDTALTMRHNSSVTINPQEKGNTMPSLAEQVAARSKMSAGNPPVTLAVPAAATTAPAPAAVAAPASGNVPAPWAKATCVACRGLGFNPQGNPCMICNHNAKVEKQPLSSDYDLTPVGDGTIYWRLKADSSKEGISPMVASAGVPVVTETRVAAPAPVAVPVQQATAPVQAPTPVQTTGYAVAVPTQAAAAPAATPPAPVKGRSKAGFTLILNAVVSKGEKKTTRLLDVFKDACEELGKAAGKDYNDLDAFRRRDEMRKVAEALAEKLGSDFVTADVTNGSPDFKAMVEAIRPYAAMEIVGTN